MGEFVYRVPGTNFGFTPEIMDAVRVESVSLFDVEPGTKIDLDLSFDDDGRRTGRVALEVTRPARREDWDRGSFTVTEAEFSFTHPLSDLVGRTGSIDAAIDFVAGDPHSVRLGQAAHISRGRHLVMNFDIPDKPDYVNKLVPFVLDFDVTPPQT